ncbi:MAG: tetratricopeptide repeat protein, partial [Theionarchaea archaeon]|nr:tetratricopeptide repeat protein [Theionarchaea archaeon]
MKDFKCSINEARFKQAKSLIKKYSRNKGNELSKELLSLGIHYGIAENYDLAIFCLELAQRISKDTRIKGEARKYLAVVHNILGLRLTRIGSLDQAETHFKIAISLRPDFSQFYNNYAILLRKRGCFREAKEQYEIALRLKPEDHEVQNNYATLLLRMGNLEEAEQYFNRLLLNTDYFPAQLTCSLFLIDTSRFVEAESLLNVLLETHPEDPRIWGNLGITLFAQGVLDRSEECFLKARDFFIKEGSTSYAVAAEGYLHWIEATREWASGSLDTSSKHFISASEKFDQPDFELQSLIMALLSQLILFDRGLTSALQSRNLVEFRDSITRIYHDMEYIVENARTTRLPPLQILFCKFKYIEVLYNALQFRANNIEELKDCKDLFSQFEFRRDFQLINSLDNFLQDLKDYQNLETIPLEKKEELMRMIQPFYTLNEMITGELSRKALYEMSIPSPPWLEEKRQSTNLKEEQSESFEYDLALSFAGEDREIAEELAAKLQEKDVIVFYDNFYKSELWGKELRKHFRDIYGRKARFVVVLISEYYPMKDWTDFEFSVIKEEARKRENDFVLPIRLDETKIIGI